MVLTTQAKKKFLVNVAFIAVLVGISFLLLKYVAAITVPFIIGFLVALVLQKPVAFLAQKTHIKRGIWSAFSVVLIIVVLFSLLIWLGIKLYNEMLSFADSLTGLIPSVTETFSSLSDRFESILTRLPDSIEGPVRALPTQLATSLAGYLGELVGALTTSVVTGLPSFLITFIVTIIAGIFITADYNRITAFILRQFSPKMQDIIMQAKNLFMQSVFKMLGSYLLLMFITFLELSIGFKLMKMENVIALALIISIIDVLPVLGVGTVLVPWGLIELILGKTLFGVELLGLYLIILVVRNILEPRIVGKNVGLPPLVTLIAIYVGLQSFGIFGMFLFPITVIVVVNLQKAGIIHIWKEAPDKAAVKAPSQEHNETED